MVKDLEPKDVHEWLSDCPPEQAIFLKSGAYLRNVHELYDALLHMREELFEEHVSETKNDFYAWVKAVIKDEVLASQLEQVKDRLKMVLVIKRRLDELEKVEYTHAHEVPAVKEHLERLDSDIPEPAVPDEGRPDRRAKLLSWEMLFIGLIVGLILGYVLAAYVQPLIG